MASSRSSSWVPGGGEAVPGPRSMAGGPKVAAVAPTPRPTFLNISFGSGSATPPRQHNTSGPPTPITNGSLKARLQGDYITHIPSGNNKGCDSPGLSFASRVASQRHNHYRRSMDAPPKYDDIFCPPTPVTTPIHINQYPPQHVIVNNMGKENNKCDKRHIKNYFLKHFSKPESLNKSGVSVNNSNMGVGSGKGQGMGVEPCYREIHINPPAGGPVGGPVGGQGQQQGQAKLNRQLSVSGPTTDAAAAAAPAPAPSPSPTAGGVVNQDLSAGYVLGLPVNGVPGATQGRPFTISLKPGHYRVNVQWRSKQHPFRITLTPRKPSGSDPPAPPPHEQQPLLYNTDDHPSLPRRLVHRLLFRQPSPGEASQSGSAVLQNPQAQQGGVYPIPLQQYTRQQQHQLSQGPPHQQQGPHQQLHHTQSVNNPPLNQHRRGQGGLVVPGSPGNRKGLKRGAWGEAAGSSGGRHSKQRKNRHRWASFSCMHLSSLDEASHSETSGPESFSGYEGSEHLARHGAPSLANKAQSLETLPSASSALGEAAAMVAAAAQGLIREAESCLDETGGGDTTSTTGGGGTNSNSYSSGGGSNGGGITNNVPSILSSQERVNLPIVEDLQECSVDDDSFIFIEKSQLMFNHAVSCEVLRNEDSDMTGVIPSEIITPRVNRKTWHEDEAFVRQVVDEYFKDPLPLSDEDMLETTKDKITGAFSVDPGTADTSITSNFQSSDLSDTLLGELSCGSSLSSVHGELTLSSSSSSTEVEELCTARQHHTKALAVDFVSPSIDNTTYCDSDETSNSWFTDDSQGYEGDIEPSDKETLLGQGGGCVAWRPWRSAPDVRASSQVAPRRQQRHHWRHGHSQHSRGPGQQPPRPAAAGRALPPALLPDISLGGGALAATPGNSCCCTHAPKRYRDTEHLPAAGDLALLPRTALPGLPRGGYAAAALPRKCLSVGDCNLLRPLTDFAQVQRFKKHRLKKFDECGQSDSSSRRGQQYQSEGNVAGGGGSGRVTLIDNYHELVSSTAESIFSEVCDTTQSFYSETSDVCSSLATSQDFNRTNLNLEFVNKAFKPTGFPHQLNISDNPNYAAVNIKRGAAAALAGRPCESLEFVSGEYRAGLCGSVGRLDVVSGSGGVGEAPHQHQYPPPAAPSSSSGRGKCECSELLCPCMLRRLQDLGSSTTASGTGTNTTVDDSTGERTQKILSHGFVVQNSNIQPHSAYVPIEISSSETNLSNRGLLVINSSYKNSEVCKSDESLYSYNRPKKVLFGGHSSHARRTNEDMREEQQRIMANAKTSLNLLTPMPYQRPQPGHKAAPVGAPPGRRQGTQETSSNSNVPRRQRLPSGESPRGLAPNAPVRTAASLDLVSGGCSVQTGSPVLRRVARVVNHSPCRRPASRDHSASRFHMTSSETSLDSFEKHEQLYENLDGTGAPLMVQSLTNLARGEGLRQGTAAANAMSASVGASSKSTFFKVQAGSGSPARGEPPPAPKRSSSLEGPLNSSRSSLGESPVSRPTSDASSSSVSSCCHHTPNPLSRILASRAASTGSSSSKKADTSTTPSTSNTTSSATTPASVIHIGDTCREILTGHSTKEYSMHKVQVADPGTKKKFVGATQRTLIELPLGGSEIKSQVIKEKIIPKSTSNILGSSQGARDIRGEDDAASYENLVSLKNNSCISEYRFGEAPVMPRYRSNNSSSSSTSNAQVLKSAETVVNETKKPTSKNVNSKSKGSSNNSNKSKPRKYFSGILNALKGSSSSTYKGDPASAVAAAAAGVGGRESRLGMVREVWGTGSQAASSSGSSVPQSGPPVSPRSKRRGLPSPSSQPSSSSGGQAVGTTHPTTCHGIARVGAHSAHAAINKGLRDRDKNTSAGGHKYQEQLPAASNVPAASGRSDGGIVYHNSRLINNTTKDTQPTVPPTPPSRRRNYSQPNMTTTTPPAKQQTNHRTQSESPRTRREPYPAGKLPNTSSKGISPTSYVVGRGSKDRKGVVTEALKDIEENSISQESLSSSRESFYSSYEHPSSNNDQSLDKTRVFTSSGHERINSGHNRLSSGNDRYSGDFNRHRHSSGHDRHSSGHDRHSSGHDRHSSGHDVRNASGHDRQSSGNDRHSSGHERHSSGHERHSSGHDVRNASGHDRQSSGNDRHSSGHERHSSGHDRYTRGHEQQPSEYKRHSGSYEQHLISQKQNLSGKGGHLGSVTNSQDSNSDSNKKALFDRKKTNNKNIDEESKVNLGKFKQSDCNESFSSGLDFKSVTDINSTFESENSEGKIINKDSKWELGSAIKDQLKDLGIDLNVSLKGESSNVLNNDEDQTPVLYENLSFLNSLHEHISPIEPKKDDPKPSSTNNPSKTHKSSSSHTDSSTKSKSHQKSNKDKNTKSFSSSFASAGGLSDASNANSSSSSGKKDVGGRSGGPQCLGLGGVLGGMESSASKVSPGGRRRPPLSRPTGLPITPTRSRRSSLSSTNSGGSLSSPTRLRKTIAEDIYCGEDSSEEGSRDGQLSRSASTGSMVSECTSFYYTAGGSTLYDAPHSKASEFESARNSLATEYASVRDSFASESLYENIGLVSNGKSNEVPPDPGSCEATTVSFTVRTPSPRPKRTISGDYNCDVDVSFSDGEIKVRVRTKEEEANRLHRDKNGKGGRQGKDKKVKDNVQKTNSERDKLHSNSDVRLKEDIKSADSKFSKNDCDSGLDRHTVPCDISDSNSISSVSKTEIKGNENCNLSRDTNSERSGLSKVNSSNETKVSEDPLYVNLRKKGTKESRKNNQDSDSSDTETEDRRTSGVWRHGGDADGESSDGEDVEEDSVSPSVIRYFNKTNKEPTEAQDQVFRIPRISQPDDEDDDEEADDPAVEVSFDQSTGAPTPPRYASPRPTTPFSNDCTNDSNAKETWDANQGEWDWHRQVWEHHQQVHNQHLQHHHQMQQIHQQQSGLLNDVVTSLSGRWGYCHGHSPGSLHGSRGSSEDRGISPDRVSLRSSGTTSPCTSKPPPSPLPPSGRPPVRDPSSVPRDSSRPVGREDRSCKSRRKARSASAGKAYRVELEISPQVYRKPRPSSFCNLASRRTHSHSPDPEPVEDDLALQLGLRPEEALYYLSSSGPAPSSLNRRGLAERKKNEGNELYKAKDYREALKLYAEAIKLCPDCAAYYSNRSACYMMLGKYHDALNDAREAVRLDSTFVKGYIRVAKCNIALGDATAALSVLRQASEYEPSNRTVRDEINNGQALIRCQEEVTKAAEKQDYRTAIFHLDRALELAVGCRALKINKAEYLVFLHRYADAQEIVNEILQYESSNADAIYVRGMCLYYQDNAEQAFNHFQQVLRFAPDHKKARDIYKKAKVLKQKKEEGNEAFKKADFQVAYNLYTEALAIDPLNKHTNAKLYFNRATVGSKLNNATQAIDDCTAAINLDEGYLKAYLRRAKCYQQEEKHEEAVRDYEKVCKLDRNTEHKRLLHESKIQLKRSKRKDYYKILGVQKGGTEDEIKKSYRKMALVHHPDRHANATDKEKHEHEVKFKEIGEAYAVLTDTKKRAMYDRGQDVNDPDGGFGHDGDIDPNQIFQAFFGGGGHGGFQFGGPHQQFQQQGFPGGFRGQFC